MDLASINYYRNLELTETETPLWLRKLADKHVRAGDRVVLVENYCSTFAEYITQKDTQVLAISPITDTAAKATHPKVSYHKASFPLDDDSPLWDLRQNYNFLFCVDLLVHVSEHQIFTILQQFQKLLAVGGYLLLSTQRGVPNLDKKSRDAHGVLFCQREVEQYQLVLERLGFDIIDKFSEQNDEGASPAELRETIIAILQTRISP